MTTKVKARDLRLGDVVRLYDGKYADATVKQIKDNEVTFFRPYTATEDFTYTGGVICYVGIEEVTVWRDGSSEFEVIERKTGLDDPAAGATAGGSLWRHDIARLHR